jgi:hypothetical protein
VSSASSFNPHQTPFGTNARDFPTEIAKESCIYCLLTFFVSYYFSMAQIIWWLVLMVAWFLEICLKMSGEKVNDFFFTYLQFLPWILPMVKSIFVLLFHAIEISPDTNLGAIAKQNIAINISFVVLPLSCYVLVIIIFAIINSVKLNCIKPSEERKDSSVDNRTNDSKKYHRVSSYIQSRLHISKVNFIRFNLAVYTIFILVVYSCEIVKFLKRNSWESEEMSVDFTLNLIKNTKIKIVNSNDLQEAGECAKDLSNYYINILHFATLNLSNLPLNLFFVSILYLN